MKGSEKINIVLEYCSLNPSDFQKKIGAKSVQNIYDIQKDKVDISKQMASKIVSAFPELNVDWLLLGKGNMLKSSAASGKKLIPFYDDVSTIGGVNDKVANLQSVSQPTEYIDTGDWFKEATAAIRHYGESMVEYPPGCILALKKVNERQLIVWGKDYMIETNEYRITKRVQRGKSDEYIKAYSTNIETYPDGQLIHEPIDIAWNDVRSIFIVLGYVVKKNGGTMVFSNQQK